jgi:hypothetical protein
MRSLLYKVASIMGWVNAANRGTLPQRVVRVTLWRLAMRLINRVK